MNRGFTLAELLGVIAILGVIALIVTITVNKNIKNSSYQTCLIQEEAIKESVEVWMIDHPEQLTDKTQIELYISDLEKEGYLDDVKSPMTGQRYSDNTKIIITNKENTKNYNYQIVYGLEKENCIK